MKHAILCVDDEKDNVDALERLFRKKYTVFKALSGDQGLEILNQNKVSLIISDQRMPNMTGVEFLEKSQVSHPETMRILLTGYTDLESVVAAINSGQVYRYITKPWDPVDLANTVDQAIERYDLSRELKEKNIVLNQALEELKTLDEAKNHFMILINHELKTPLTVISSYMQLLQTTSLNTEQTKFLNRIMESTERLEQLISDVLILVSAETGITQAQIKKTTTNTIIEGLAERHTQRMAEKQQTFKTNVHKASLKADVQILRTVLERLIDNAIKFSPTKSEIQLYGDKHKTEDLYRFSVINEGGGLSQAAIQKILKPFSLDEDIMHHSKGAGLGLNICQALLKTHKSQLTIASEKKQFVASFDIHL